MADWIIGTVGATATYCIVLVAVREVSFAELRAFAAAVRLRAQTRQGRRMK